MTEKGGTVDVSLGHFGPPECSSWGCDTPRYDIRFADGSRRHLAQQSDRVFGFLDGGNRNMNVIAHSACAIGRFHGRHLVGLRFPPNRTALATNDYPGSGLHSAAKALMMISPIVAFLAWCVWAFRDTSKRRRS